jgi:hypothetical protein
VEIDAATVQLGEISLHPTKCRIELHAQDWAAGFWVGTATASLVGIIVAAAALLTHVI